MRAQLAGTSSGTVSVLHQSACQGPPLRPLHPTIWGSPLFKFNTGVQIAFLCAPAHDFDLYTASAVVVKAPFGVDSARMLCRYHPSALGRVLSAAPTLFRPDMTC